MFTGPNPDPYVKQSFTDPNTGIFNPGQVAQYDAQIKQSKDPAQIKQWSDFKESVMKNRRINKYINLVKGGLYAPKFLLDEAAAQSNTLADISYVMVPYTAVSDNDVKVSEAEIKEYMSKNKNRYIRDEDKASIEYVNFPIIPSKADSAKSLGYLEKVREDFVKATDAEVFVGEHSDDLFDDVYYNENTLTSENKEALLNAGVGTVIGPYYDNGRYKLSKVLSKKSLPDSVRASHILIKIDQNRNEEQAKASIDSLEKMIKSGTDFATLAAQRSEDGGSGKQGGDLGYFAPGQMVPEFNEACFEGSTGDLKIVKTQFGYHLIKIVDQKNFKPNIKIATVAKIMEAGQETINAAYAKANQFLQGAKNEKTFSDNAKKMGRDKRVANEINKTQSIVPGLGNVRSLVRWAYEAKPGDISAVFNTDDQCIVARLVSRTPAGELGTIENYKTEIESEIKKEKKAEKIAAKAKGSLEQVASAYNTEVRQADSVSMMGPRGGNLGFEPKVFGASQNKNLVQKVSGPIPGQQGVYFVSVRNRMDLNKPEMRNAFIERMQVEGQYLRAVDQMIPAVLKKKAQIEDNRAMFY